MRFKLLLLLSFFSFTIFSQDKIVLDSLLFKLKNTAEDRQKVDVLCRLSDYYSNHNLTKSFEYASDAFDVADKLGESSLVASMQFKRGQLFLLLGDYDEALSQLFKSLKHYEDTVDLRLLYKVYNAIGAVYDRIKDYDKALDYYFKAIDSYNKGASLPYAANENLYSVYNNIGNVYHSKRQMDTASEYYHKALGLAKAADDKQVMGAVYNNLGKLYIVQEKYEDAYAQLQNSLQCREKVNDIEGMAKTHLFFANYYMITGEEDKALQSLDNSLLLGKQMGSIHTQNMAYLMLTAVFEKKGKPAKALEMHKLYKQTSDSLINEKTIQDITAARMQFEFEKKEKLTRAEQQKTRFKFLLTIAVLALVVAVVGLLYALLKINAKRMKLKQENMLLEKKSLEQDLQVKNKELTTSVMYLLKKNELMNDVSIRLMDLKSHLKKENLGPIQKILLDLQAGADKYVWKEFELRFQAVHKDFYDKLRAGYPDLTPAQVKICAFLKLNMSSKEISSITHQSVNTIEVLRSRIRKKLNLTNKNVNLVTFLREL